MRSKQRLKGRPYTTDKRNKMPHTLQDFLATAIQKAATDLEAALLRLPEDKRSWSALDKARTALDQVAECAMLNGSTAELIQARRWATDFDFAEYQLAKNELQADWDRLQPMLKQNTEKVIAAVRAVPDEDLSSAIEMPWGPMTLAQIVAYPYWNMSYHEGQINFIASMLGCLE